MQHSLIRIQLIKNQLSSNNKDRNEQKRKIVSCALDYLYFDEFLTEDERSYRRKLRNFIVGEKISEKFNNLIESQNFDSEIPKLIAKNFPELFKGLSDLNNSVFKWAVSLMEIGRCDINLSSFFAIQSELCVKTLFYYGSDLQKRKYLEKLGNLSIIGSWALTEENFGSDASSLQTSAEEVEKGFIINGRKRWIGNGTIADIYFIWARNTKTNKVQCFIVEKGTKGLSSERIESKLALRAVQNANLTLDNVFIPKENCLPGVRDFNDTNKVLLISRLGVTWTAIGVALGVYDTAVEYTTNRKQFGKSISAFQINQLKLGNILGNIQAMILYAKRVSELFRDGKLTMGKVSLCKAYCTKLLREIVALGRELLGGNGILMEYKIMKSFVDAEAIYTYEGTYDINMLVAGSEITGIKAFK